MSKLIKSLNFEYKADTNKRVFSGYASTWEKDLGNDIIDPKAFDDTIEKRFKSVERSRIKVLWQHAEPIGLPLKLEPDSKGLYVEAKISKTQLGDEALELMADGVVDQLSIGYSIDEEAEGEDGARLLKRVSLHEFSPVTFPMNEGTSIETVQKSAITRSAGFSFEDMQNLIIEMKEGRTLNRKNVQRIQDAIKALQAVLTDSDPEKQQGNDLASFKHIIDEMRAYSKGAR